MTPAMPADPHAHPGPNPPATAAVPMPYWLLGFVILAVHGAGLAVLGGSFDLERPGDVSTEGIYWLTGLQVIAGFLFLGLIPLIGRTPPTRLILALVFGAGLAARLAQLGNAALIEDDFFRYFLDGFLTLKGLNPFMAAPSALLATDGGVLGLPPLTDAARDAISKVNHPDVRSIYPMTAQAAFALAALIEPWSLDAWRMVMIAADVGAAILMLKLLGHLGLSPLWLALYWLNPLAITQIANLAHMEPLLLLCLLASLWCAFRGRPAWSGVCLALAAGVKVWPIFLWPLFAARWFKVDGTLIRPTLAFGAGCLVVALPVFFAPLDMTNGFAAYGAHWINTAPVFDALRSLVAAAGVAAGFSDGHFANATLRLAIWGTVGLFALWLARLRVTDDSVFVSGCFWMGVVFFLASPAKLPWYTLWFLGLLPLVRAKWLAIATPTAAIYYLNFAGADGALKAIIRDGFGQPPAQSWIAWAAMGPIWLAALAHLVTRGIGREVRHGH